jgi:branched-chain amino acid transport system ATP-binding protein
VTPVLEARALDAGYEGTAVIRGLDLHVGAGEVVALLGPNGAGKTTTLMTLAGHLRAMGGEVLVQGVPTTAPVYRRVLGNGLAVVTERRAVFTSLTVADNLRVTRGDPDYAMELFPALQDHLKRRVSMLSGGQQQMLALACALARRPKILLADELSLGLAPLVVDRLLETLRTAADAGLAVLLVEQHVHKALAIADRAYVMRRGQIRLSGDAADLRQRTHDIETAYLADSPRPTAVA